MRSSYRPASPTPALFFPNKLHVCVSCVSPPSVCVCGSGEGRACCPTGSGAQHLAFEMMIVETPLGVVVIVMRRATTACVLRGLGVV